MPFISICIPAYKRIDFLKRLLDSIAVQTFNDFEVVLTDDSPSAEVEELCKLYKDKFLLRYKKNPVPLGTPENWNEAIRQATGEWIKIMHDDDWFSAENALEKFANAAQKHQGNLLFSSYYNVNLSNGKKKRIIPPAFLFRALKKEPVSLLYKNIIGPPSVILHKNDGTSWYDANIKWLVDIDMYIRRLQHEEITYIPDPLICVGLGTEQVTSSVYNDKRIQIAEHFYFLEKTGIKKLNNLLVYDYWWRFFRNFNIHSLEEINQFGYSGAIHPVLWKMIQWQKKIPRSILKIGFFSKLLMLIHFIVHWRKLNY